MNAFLTQSINTLQTVVTAIGGGLSAWGVINLLEGYGNDNPGAKSQGIKQLMVHTPEFIPATLEPTANCPRNATLSQREQPTANSYMVHASAPIHGVAPGQFCVIYDNRHHRCYGSGEITI